MSLPTLFLIIAPEKTETHEIKRLLPIDTYVAERRC